MTAAENAMLGTVAIPLGIASAFAQFMGAKIHGWLPLIAVSLVLTSLTVGAIILLHRVRNVPLSIAFVTGVLAAVVGGGIGYLIRAEGDSPHSDQSRTAAPARSSGDHGPRAQTASQSAAPPSGDIADGRPGDHGDVAAKDPSGSIATPSAGGQQRIGRFENKATHTSGCLTGLQFMISQSLPAGKNVWVMVYGHADQGAIYPVRELDFTAGRAAVPPFPVGSEADSEGSRFEVLGVLVDATTTARYEKQARSSHTLPVELDPPGPVLDRLTVVRGGKYAGCR